MSSGAIFQNQGKTAASVEFASNDPTAAEFLKPRGGELKAPGAPGRDKFIGAVAP